MVRSSVADALGPEDIGQCTAGQHGRNFRAGLTHAVGALS